MVDDWEELVTEETMSRSEVGKTCETCKHRKKKQEFIGDCKKSFIPLKDFVCKNWGEKKDES